MLSNEAKAFGDLSKQKVAENLAFTEHMELHGKKLQIPCRSGLRDAIFYSGGDGVRPTIFEIYGGCFSQGYVANNDRMRTRMRDATGYHVIGLDYRKSPEHPYPCGLEDVFDAVCYFCDHAAEYGIDTDRLATWGHSAGGNFACVLALMARDTGRFRLRAQLLDYPYLDAYKPGIEKTTSSTGLTAGLLDSMNEIYADRETRYGRYLSPIHATADELRGAAPAAIVICGNDPLHMEAEEMVQHFLQAGVPVLARKFPEASHGFLEHWFFREWYLNTLSAEERSIIPENIEQLAEDGLAFVISAARYYLEA